MSLGLTTTPVPITMPTFNAGSVQAAVPASSGNLWSSILNIGSQVANTIKTVAPAVQNAKSTIDALRAKTQTQTQQPGTSYTPAPAATNNQSSSTPPPPAADEGMSTTAKVLIGVGIASALASGIYLIVSSSQKGKGLGCPCEENKTIDTKAEVVSSELGGVKKGRKKGKKR